ncbi:MAG: hypothetical protein DI549_00690 [Ancylobacter novellus]|uniref:Uncharacterized protein n=1 Tax=Ancylobacter novellus TaxID=921 RepID=A0A2W5R5N8_ANCNO|nr:MAG: hypothetical protein DI549_00690 [Ancylobacter novellus]
MKDWLRPGQMVVCIDDDWSSGNCVESRRPVPVAGCVYVIADVGEHGGGFYLLLEEMGGGIWFLSSHFRPVRPTSLDCLTHLLAPSDALEPVQ